MAQTLITSGPYAILFDPAEVDYLKATKNLLKVMGSSDKALFEFWFIPSKDQQEYWDEFKSAVINAVDKKVNESSTKEKPRREPLLEEGQVWKIDECTCLVCQASPGELKLINLESGNRYHNVSFRRYMRIEGVVFDSPEEKDFEYLGRFNEVFTSKI